MIKALLLLAFGLAAPGRAELTVTARAGEILERELQQAQTRIDLQIPYLSDAGFLQALTRAASRGVTLRVILDPGSKANRESAAALSPTGASLRWLNPNMPVVNTRLLLLDGAKACIGSFNGSKTSLRQRFEALACVEDEASLDVLAGWFEKVWSQGLSELPESAKAADELESLPDPRTLVESEPRVTTRRKGAR